MRKRRASEVDQKIVFNSEREMPPLAVSLGTMLFNKTGSWRYLRPIYENKMPPCNDACPAGNDIQGFIALINEEKIKEAWELIKKTNPLPGVCGRVCYHPCETACNRAKFDEPISIHALERLAADYGRNTIKKQELKLKPKRAEHVAVIGSGPAGLACAWKLAPKYNVTVFEAEKELGGMLRVGIPQYRLPRDILDEEIADIAALGVAFKTNTRIGKDITLEDLIEQYDAIFIATGAHLSRPLDIPGENLEGEGEGEGEGVISGLDFLRALNLGEGMDMEIGKQVAIIGGGNTAIDAARSSLRLGAKPIIIYRRTKEEMPAIPEEVEEAEREGISFIYLAAPNKIFKKKGKLQVEFIKMRLGEPDESGRRRPVPIVGSEFVMDFDAVIAAIGEQPDLAFLPDMDMYKRAHVYTCTPSHNKLFFGGDAATGAGTVVDAIASGKEGAELIDRFLSGQEAEKEKPEKPELAQFESLNLDYFEHQKQVEMPSLPLPERVNNFKEVNCGFSLESGQQEASRCFSCGVCNRCDNCFIFCPDVAVSRKDGIYKINYDYCKGCGLCAAECPRNAISLVEEMK